MYRSASTNNMSIYTSSPSLKVPTALRALSQEPSELPVYEPQSDPAKKEKTRTKSAEKTVHVIPFVLLLCALSLWFFSNPDINLKGNVTVGGKVEGMAIDADLDRDGTKHLPVELGDVDETHLIDPKAKLSQNRP